MSATFTEYPITEPVQPVRLSKPIKQRVADKLPTVPNEVKTAGRGAWAGTKFVGRGFQAYGQLVRHAPQGVERVAGRPWNAITDRLGAQQVHRMIGQAASLENAAKSFDKRNKRIAKENKGKLSPERMADAQEAWAAAAGAGIELEEARTKHNRRLRWRALPAGVLATGLAGYGLHEFAQVPHLIQGLSTTGVVFGAPVGFSRIGRPKTVAAERVKMKKRKLPVITDKLIESAWSGLKLSKVGELDLLDSVQEMADKSGWVVPVLLPGTLLVDDIENVHGQFAKGLNRRRELVHIIRDATQGEGFFWLRVYRKDAEERVTGDSPLAGLTETNVHDDLVLAETALGAARSINIGNNHLFIGGRSQMGKSATIEQICAWLMLDRDADLHVIDLSGKKKNYERLEPLTSYFLCGLGPDVLDETMAYLEWLDKLRATRNDESKPLYIVLDEIHELVKGHGKKANDLLDRLGRNTLGMNIRFIVATQQPDSGSIPSGLLGQCGVRIGLPVRQSWVSDLIIDNGQQRKIDCSKLPQVAGYCVIDDEQGATQARIYPPDTAVIEAKVQLGLSKRGGVVEKIDLTPKAEQAPAKRKSTKFPHLLQDILDMETAEDEGKLQNRQIVERLLDIKRDEYQMFWFDDDEPAEGERAKQRDAAAVELSRELRGIFANQTTDEGKPFVRDVNKKKQDRGTAPGVYINEIHNFINGGTNS